MLEQCVLLTQTCRAFKEPALAVLWRSIKISPMNIHLVADAVRFGWHRMHSVRNIKFESTPIGHSREDVELVMRQLPRLDNLQVHRSDPRPSPYKCGDFFDVLFMRPDLQISTRELDLSFKSELFDLSKILSHFQHLEHLTLAVDRQGSKYSKAVIQPLTALQLKTLSLYLPPEPQTEDEPIINLFRTLAPACMHLQELCITIDEHAYPFLHRFFTLSKLGASTIHTVEFKVLADKMLELNSTVNPAAIISPQLSLERFIASTAPQSNLERRLPSLPALRHLKLTEFGCTHEMMAALDPAKLQTLHLVVPPKQGSFAGWAECADDVVKSIEGLKELEHIVVEFGILPGVPAYRQAFWGVSDLLAFVESLEYLEC